MIRTLTFLLPSAGGIPIPNSMTIMEFLKHPEVPQMRRQKNAKRVMKTVLIDPKCKRSQLAQCGTFKSAGPTYEGLEGLGLQKGWQTDKSDTSMLMFIQGIIYYSVCVWTVCMYTHTHKLDSMQTPAP